MPRDNPGNLSPSKIINDHFSRLSEEDYLEVQGEAILFLSRDTGHSSLNQPISEEQAALLKKHLSRYFEEKQRELFGRSLFGRSGVRTVSDFRDETNENTSDEEVISRISGLAQDADGRMISLEKGLGDANQARREDFLQSLDLRREQLREILPVIEYEALEIKTQDEIDRQPRFTLGFDQIGLQMLFRRACIRMLWHSQKTK
ncbi:MAG: hypothetical protein AABO57_23650 [Acidobacteriota bacterium]